MKIRFCLFTWNENVEYDKLTVITTYDDNISKYCVLMERENDIIINVLALSNHKIINNLSCIEADINHLISSGVIKFIDWIENEECSKMMLCDYTFESIEEYLKSLL